MIYFRYKSFIVYNYVTYRRYLLHQLFIYLRYRSLIFHMCLNIFSCELQLESSGNNRERCNIPGSAKDLGKCFRKTFWDISFNGFQFPARCTARGFIREQINSSNCRVFNILFPKLSVSFQKLLLSFAQREILSYKASSIIQFSGKFL